MGEIEEKETQAFVQGMVAVLQALLRPVAPQEESGYEQLFWDMFLGDLWGGVVLGPVAPEAQKHLQQETTPARSPSAVREAVVARMVSQYRDHILPSWNREVPRLLEEAIQLLESPEPEIIKGIYGIGSTSKSTLREVGDQVGLSRERVRQICNRALRKLQKAPHTERIRQLCGMPLGELVDKFRGCMTDLVDLERRLEAAEALVSGQVDDLRERLEASEEIMLSSRVRILLTRIETMNLSERLRNRLPYDEKDYLGDVVMCTEREMLKVKNFGRKTLTELKEVLEAQGLSLGMELDPAVRKEFARRRMPTRRK